MRRGSFQRCGSADQLIVSRCQVKSNKNKIVTEYPRGHKGADLKSAVLALNQLVGSNPTSVAKRYKQYLLYLYYIFKVNIRELEDEVAECLKQRFAVESFTQVKILPSSPYDFKYKDVIQWNEQEQKIVLIPEERHCVNEELIGKRKDAIQPPLIMIIFINIVRTKFIVPVLYVD